MKIFSILRVYKIGSYLTILDLLEKLLLRQKTKFLAGDELTWADLVFECVVERVEDYIGNLLDTHPLLKGINDSVINHPKIAAWKAKRPVTDY
jgi:glutathione S-transferase